MLKNQKYFTFISPTFYIELVFDIYQCRNSLTTLKWQSLQASRQGHRDVTTHIMVGEHKLITQEAKK